MKKLIILSCMLMIVDFGFSQINTSLQGLAAKNAKPWHKKSKKGKVVFAKNKEFLKGPAAKNEKSWHKEDTGQVYVETGRRDKHDLKGPKAKNFKPWMSSKPNEVNTLAVKKRDSSQIKLAIE